MGNNIKMDLKEINWQNVDGINFDQDTSRKGG
jgi:hypothetical protein